MADGFLCDDELGRVKDILDTAVESGLGHLTLIEENTGTTCLTQYFDFILQGIDFTHNKFSIHVLDKVLEEPDETAGLSVNLVPAYSGKADIVAAIKQLAKVGTRTSDLEMDLGCRLLPGKLPEPDLMVFFDGCKVLGEAGVWIGAYSEFAFWDQSWQSFSSSDLDRLLKDYGMRERRFGAVRSGAK